MCVLRACTQIKDLDGDKRAGVRTVPVAFGAKSALWLSLIPLAASILVGASAGSSIIACAATMPLIIQGAFAVRAFKCGFTNASLLLAIELAPLWLTTTLIALTI